MTSPRVSVIIPVHNAGRYLEQCLDSVLSQTETDIEVICINDSSTDNSQDILEHYSRFEPRISILNTDCHCAGTARNLGMGIAHGRYLSFLDADDFFESEMLKETADALDSTEADIVVYGSWIFDTATGTDRHAKWNLKTELLPEKPVFSWRDMPDFIFNAFGNYTWNKLFRSSLIQGKQIKFQEIPRTNDLLFTCVALVEAEGITTIEKSFAHYRVNSNTSLQATNDRTPTAFLDAFLELDRYLRATGRSTDLMRSYLSHLLDGIVANANSVKTLDSLGQIKNAVVNSIEPRFELLKLCADTFDHKQLNQYSDLLELDLANYLLARTHSLISEKDELSRYTEWIDWRLWKTSCHASEVEHKIGELEEELRHITRSRSYRLARVLGAPIRAFREPGCS